MEWLAVNAPRSGALHSRLPPRRHRLVFLYQRFNALPVDDGIQHLPDPAKQANVLDGDQHAPQKEPDPAPSQPCKVIELCQIITRANANDRQEPYRRVRQDRVAGVVILRMVFLIAPQCL